MRHQTFSPHTVGLFCPNSRSLLTWQAPWSRSTRGRKVSKEMIRTKSALCRSTPSAHSARCPCRRELDRSLAAWRTTSASTKLSSLSPKCCDTNSTYTLAISRYSGASVTRVTCFQISLRSGRRCSAGGGEVTKLLPDKISGKSVSH